MAPKIDKLPEKFSLGLGLHWDPASQSLYFLNNLGQTALVKYDPVTNTVTQALTAHKEPTFVIPIEGKKDHFIIALNEEIAVITWDGQSDQFTIIEKLCVADKSKPSHKFSDGKCDSSRRLWTGTFYLKKEDKKNTHPASVLYSFDSTRQLKSHFDLILMIKGLVFNDQEKKMFVVNSLSRSVSQFDFDIANGAIANKQIFFTFKNHGIVGVPNGLTIDTDGNLWLPVFGSGKVIKIDGKKTETLLETIELCATQLTSVTFGGPNLDELYVTSACIEYNGKKPNSPDDGAVFKITGTGSKGFPGNTFKLN